jgi:hypothetical protein
MSDRKREILNSLERIDYYRADNPQLATELPVTVELFAANKTNIADLHAAGVTSDTMTATGKSQTRSKVARARSVASDLRRVARTAKLIEKKKPGFANAFEMPGGYLSYQDLIDKAQAFAIEGAKNQTDFDKYGLKEEFFNDLSQDVAELGEASEGQADAKRGGVGATADTETILENALDVRGELKVAIENHYRNDAAKLAEWHTASHIRNRRSEPKTEPENPQT